MKNLSILFVFATTILFFFGCDKDDNLQAKRTLKGTVFQAWSDIPVPKAKVFLYREEWTGSLLNFQVNTAKIDSTIANEKGEYSFDIIFDNGYDYFVRAHAKNHNSNSSYVEIGSTKTDLALIPFAWIALRIINTPPINSSDRVRVGPFLPENGEENDFSKFNNCDTLIIKKINGNKKYPLSIYLRNESGVKIYYDSIYCKGLDTTYHSIVY